MQGPDLFHRQDMRVFPDKRVRISWFLTLSTASISNIGPGREWKLWKALLLTCLLQHPASPRINPRCDELSLWSRYQGIRVLQGATSETTRSLATGRTGLNGEGKKGRREEKEAKRASCTWTSCGQKQCGIQLVNTQYISIPCACWWPFRQSSWLVVKEDMYRQSMLCV